MKHCSIYFFLLSLFMLSYVNAQENGFSKVYSNAIADKAVTKDEYLKLKTIILEDGVIDKIELDSIYLIGLSGMNKFIVTNGDNIDILVKASIYESMGNAAQATKILKKAGFYEKAKETEKNIKDLFWTKNENGIITIGITKDLLKQDGDVNCLLIFNEVNNIVKKGDTLFSVVLENSEQLYYSSVDGIVIDTNDNETYAPIFINSDPTGLGWIIKIKTSQPHK
jgi:glycine cleavage system H protein